MHIQSFNTENIHCTNCEGRVKKILGETAGIIEVQVNVLRKTMKVEFEPEKIDLAGIVKVMEDAGYKAFPIETEAKTELKELTPMSFNTPSTLENIKKIYLQIP